MGLPRQGRPAADVLAELEALRDGDVDWRAGRVFSLAYSAGPEVHALQREAYGRLMTENALNTEAFPSLARMQREVVDAVRELVHGDAGAAGFMTSGGTESILMAVLAARERARAERGVADPEMILPTTAHAAFEKAAHYFGVRSIRVPVGDDFRADAAAMASRVTPSTVLLVASAPQYPQGVVDPVAGIAAIAAERGLGCHVDACMGGMVLPFLEELGEPVPAWDFRVPGVTSISVDLHKYGYAAKGASVILHRTKGLRRWQTFTTDNWLGGLYGSPGILGTKSGGAIAAAWAVLRHVGHDGYLRLARDARAATVRLAEGIRAIPELTLRAEPDATLLAFGSRSPEVDPFAVGDALRRGGWYVDRQAPPPSLHCTVNALHVPLVDAFVEALHGAVDECRRGGARGSGGAYGTVE